MNRTTMHRRRRRSALAVVIVTGAVLGAGCTKRPPPPEGTPLAGTSWVLEPGGYLSPQVPADVRVTAEFGEGRITGSTGCNEYFGTVTTGPNRAIRVGAIGTTRRACAADVMAFEQEYVRRLGVINGYVVSEGQLVLTSGQAGPIVRPTPPPVLLRFRGG